MAIIFMEMATGIKFSSKIHILFTLSRTVTFRKTFLKTFTPV